MSKVLIRPLHKTRKGLIFFILVSTVCSSLIVFPQFYKNSHVSQLVFSLLLLDLFFVYVFVLDTQRNIRIPCLYSFILVAATVVTLNPKNHATVVAIMCLYLILLLLLLASKLRQYASIFLAYASVCTAVYGLELFFVIKIGDASSGYRISGSYGQANLMAVLMLLGLFSYSHLLITTRRNSIIYLIPSMLMATVMFMTGSRASMVDICLVVFLMLVLRNKQNLTRVKPYLISLLWVLIAAFFIAQVLGSGTPLTRAGATWSDGGGTYMRLVFWLSALLIGRDNCFIGTGFGGYSRNLGDYAIQASEKLHLTYDMIGQTLWAHNDFLQIFSQQGIIVFLIVCFFVFLLGRQFLIVVPYRGIFAFLGFISFCCMMCFSHPFYYHNLDLMLCFMVACLLSSWRCKRIVLAKKYIFFPLAIMVVVVNFFVANHIIQMHNLYKFSRHMVESEEPFTRRFIDGEKQFLIGSIDNAIYGWEFKHILYINLVQRIRETDNRKLGQYVLPAMVEYSELNRFPSYLFSLATLYYILNDYENAKKYSSLANERKPDMDEYFSLLHLCNVLLISRNNNIPVKQLMPGENFKSLSEQKILRKRQLNSKGVAI